MEEDKSWNEILADLIEDNVHLIVIILSDNITL